MTSMPGPTEAALRPRGGSGRTGTPAHDSFAVRAAARPRGGSPVAPRPCGRAHALWRWIGALAVTGAVVLGASAPVAAQTGSTFAALSFDARPPGEAEFQRPPLDVDGEYLVIHLRENRLMLMRRNRVLWSAPVATGTGFRLEGAGQEWDFGTPRGVFRVQRKETDPVWIMPDWAFVEEGLPVPPIDSPQRRRSGMLGTSAVYIGYELAMHGTNAPQLVLNPNPDDRRVSHGCIRLTNEDARTLYHLVHVGMPVLIY